ncbi:MAG: response regulator [Verrucomicrobiota bacterium]
MIARQTFAHPINPFVGHASLRNNLNTLGLTGFVATWFAALLFMANDSKSKVARRFILIDDSPFDAELIEMSLKAMTTCHVAVVCSRQEFLAELDHALPDVIISDSNIPSFDGLAALALAKRYCPEVPFIFCSGVVSEEVKTTALTLGAKAWLSKDDLEYLALAVYGFCNEDPSGNNNLKPRS